MNDFTPSSSGRRRSLLAAAVGAAGGLAAWRPAAAASAPSAGPTRSLSFEHTHTRERLSVVYAVGEQYLPDAIARLNRFLRDHYSGEIGHVDPRLFDQLHEVQRQLRTQRVIEVISAYRCPSTNTSLRTTRGGGVARNSLHLEGRAIDVRLAGVPIGELRDAALSLRAGGVGFYPAERFVHLDTGRVRHW